MPIRCYLEADHWTRNVSLTGREAHHLVHVLRVRPGDKILCLDGEGRQAEATVQAVRRGAVALNLDEPQTFPRRPPTEIALAAAIPGQGRMEAIVNEATQMGVARIVPMLTERCVVRFSEERSRRKQGHLRQIAVEALKQSGSLWLPAIDPLTPWARVLDTFAAYDRVLLAAVEGPHRPWAEALTPPPQKLLLLIGPEGDFTPEEIRQAVQAGAHRVSLGPSVLRTETACTAAIAILNFLSFHP